MPSAELDSADKRKNKTLPLPFKGLLTLDKTEMKATLQAGADHSTERQ